MATIQPMPSSRCVNVVKESPKTAGPTIVKEDILACQYVRNSLLYEDRAVLAAVSVA